MNSTDLCRRKIHLVRTLVGRVTEDGASVANPIVPVKHGTKENPWEIDGITGATISSEAIANILRFSTEEWIPRIRERIDDFATGGEG